LHQEVILPALRRCDGRVMIRPTHFPLQERAMSRRNLILLAACGSAALLLGALWFQHVVGLFPCPLCLWQRWPHLAAIALGLLALRLKGPLLPLLGALATLASAAIGLFHVGVEHQWWEGLASCTGAMEGLSMSALLDPTIPVAPTPRCDEVAWSLMGISMAGWNVICSLGLTGLWLLAARRR